MSGGRCSTTEAVNLLMPAFTRMAAADELTRAIAAAAKLEQAIHEGGCDPRCKGVAVRPDLIPRLIVVVKPEKDGGWRARIENTSYSSDQPVDVWTFAIDEVKALLPPRRKKPRRDPPKYDKIRQKANELHPEGYKRIKTNLLIDEVYTALGKDAPKSREVGERALGRRSRNRKRKRKR